MRQRRPERFSDSLPTEHPELERSVLEYHLDTLTSRSQESDFELFARAIAEREICPNLLPHTGPTGGGDSKVDTETYPVADQLTLGWYYGIGREASDERWAFAFSAKKDWRDKIQSDVEGIVGTGRGYKRVFFVTSQFVRDKDRAAVEDQLQEKYGVNVRIFDRSWLVEAVLKHGHEAIAVAMLGVPAAIRRSIRKGPRDVEREQTLEELEKRMAEALVSCVGDFQLVQDAIESALAARSLDRARLEVDGRFLRAKHLSERFGTHHQKLRAVYEWAWATYWWFEDPKRLSEQYTEVEALALGSDSAYHLELLCNLWACLYTAVSTGALEPSTAALPERTTALLRDLDRLSKDEGRLGNALYARTLALQTELLSNPDNTTATFRALKAIVERAATSANYPFEMIVDLVTEMGAPFGQIQGYDDLFALLVEMSARRQGELAAAHLLLRRGAQLLEDRSFYAAIAALGSAVSRLYKDESREEAVRALYMCGYAYVEVGLLWAARGAFVNAASTATNATWSRGEVTRLQAACFKMIKWLELRLGRLPQALAWHEVASALGSAITQSHEQNYDGEEDRVFDGAIGLLFLRADLATLRLLEAFPAALDRLGLPGSSIVLKYALGYDDEVPKEWKRVEAAEDSHESIFRTWRDQPVASQLRGHLSTGLEPAITMESRILGCHIQVHCDNMSPCVELAESVLAGIESFLSTGIPSQIVAQEPSLSITVRRSVYGDWPFSFRIVEERGQPQLIITCKDFDAHALTHEEQRGVQDRLTDILIGVFARVFHASDLEGTMTTLLRDERALERSVAFTRSFVVVGNVLGHRQRTTLSEWMEQEDPVYALKRLAPWDEADRVSQAAQLRETTIRKAGIRSAAGGEPPKELVEGYQSAKQTEIRTISLIRQTLWDDAGWRGVATLTATDDAVPPVLGLLFENTTAGTEIFQAWREELGETDEQERIYVSIIRGVSKANPFAYRVMIGTNPDTALGDGSTKYAVMTYRIQKMEPSSPQNLDRFLASYASLGRYILAPTFYLQLGHEPRVGVHLGITKADLHIKAAWQVGRHDLEVSAIREDDEPVIPEGIADVPVMEVLTLKARRHEPNSP